MSLTGSGARLFSNYGATDESKSAGRVHVVVQQPPVMTAPSTVNSPGSMPPADIKLQMPTMPQPYLTQPMRTLADEPNTPLFFKCCLALFPICAGVAIATGI